VTVISDWTYTSEMSALPDGVIHVWAWRNHSSDEPSDPDLSTLSEQEVERCLRFRFERDRISFATSHRNTRLILAHYLGISPESLTITPEPGGKPRLHGAGTERLRFNLSHCKDIGMLAVAWNTGIGIDVEQPRSVKAGVAERYFSAAELEELSSFDDDQWLAGFLRCWTRKEALLKAEGVGLQTPLDAFDVSLATKDPRLLAVRPPATFSHPWHLYDISPPSTYTACLAVSSAPNAIHRFYFPLRHR
jgi:4'-phosphopantetheinyl transferase